MQSAVPLVTESAQPYTAELTSTQEQQALLNAYEEDFDTWMRKNK